MYCGRRGEARQLRLQSLLQHDVSTGASCHGPEAFEAASCPILPVAAATAEPPPPPHHPLVAAASPARCCSRPFPRLYVPPFQTAWSRRTSAVTKAAADAEAAEREADAKGREWLSAVPPALVACHVEDMAIMGKDLPLTRSPSALRSAQCAFKRFSEFNKCPLDYTKLPPPQPLPTLPSCLGAS
jgi:hypothetical protein